MWDEAKKFHKFSEEVTLIGETVEDEEIFGAMPVRQELQVIPADEPSSMKLGWTVTETLGIGVINRRGMNSMRKYVKIPVPTEKNIIFNGDNLLVYKGYGDTYIVTDKYRIIVSSTEDKCSFYDCTTETNADPLGEINVSMHEAFGLFLEIFDDNTFSGDFMLINSRVEDILILD